MVSLIFFNSGFFLFKETTLLHPKPVLQALQRVVEDNIKWEIRWQVREKKRQQKNYYGRTKYGVFLGNLQVFLKGCKTGFSNATSSVMYNDMHGQVRIIYFAIFFNSSLVLIWD